MSKRKIAVFSPEVAEKILKKLNLDDGFSKRTPIDPKKLVTDGEFHDNNAQIYKSESDVRIPAYGCLRVTGSEFNEDMNTDVLLCDKPNGTAGAFVFNGMYEVDQGQIANCYTGEVRCYITQSPSEIPEIWGPKQEFFVEPDGNPAVKILGIHSASVGLGQTIQVGTSDVFVVELQHVGGTNGTSEQQCAWRYDITIVGDSTIIKANENIGLQPNKYRRMKLGAYHKATHCLAFYLNGELSVMTSNEVPETVTC